MKTSILGVRCITNLHIGTSENEYGVIKNEVEKDVVLGTAILPSSSIKGALRDFWHQNIKDLDKEIKIFGSAPDEKKEENKGKKGNCKFLNGQLLLRPMRVSSGEGYSYCMVTTPDLIRKMLDTFKIFGVREYKGINFLNNEESKNFNKIQEDLKKLDKSSTAGIFYFPCFIKIEVEGYKVEKNKDENPIYKMLFELAEKIPVVIMKTEFFETIDLPIIARNRLEDGKSKNLWYEEIVPHQSYFYFVTLWEKEEADIFSDFIEKICNYPVSFGGNNSVGNGYCNITSLYQEKE